MITADTDSRESFTGGGSFITLGSAPKPFRGSPGQYERAYDSAIQTLVFNMIRRILGKFIRLMPLALLLAPLASAIAAGEHEGGHGHEDGHGNGGHEVAFGQPADPGHADHTVEVIAHDTMRFEPDRIDVEAGETIRFVVRNIGQLQHSFTLGTPTGQEAHEKEMQGMAVEDMAGHMANDPTGMVIQPGETGQLTWRFTESGPVEFACHIPGHYPAGMKGRIRIK